ncbi:MAG: hypothetical protein IJZ17_04415 [Muribaculaceae bacterium]|nr:hypothetical protein [Muribaculaceae bacterium]
MPTTQAQLNWTRNATPSIKTTSQGNRIYKENHKQIPLTQHRINANIQQLNEATGITIYGFSTNVNDDTSGLVHFTSDDPWTMTRVKAIEEWPTACAYGNDAYYAMLTFAMMPKGLYTIDLESGEPTLVADYMYNENVRAAIEMSYDYTTNTMFMLTISDESNWSTAFGKVDLTTGEQTIINPNMGLYHRTLAVDQDGVVWTIDEDGGLNTIDKTTGTPTQVHNLNCYPFNRQSMEFDRNTGELYWAMCDSWDYGILYKVDVTNGTRTELGYIGRTGLEQVIGLHSPSSPCAPGAPGAISNLNILPGESGALTATISWDNPSTTHGGEVLTAIDKVELFRNGELITTLTSANPGESMSYSDNLDASGTYTYKIVLHNSEGAGMASSSSAFIGRDVPSPVTITSVTREGENAVKLDWEASTTGVNGGYLDTSSIRYKVTRISDDMVLAENLSETTFTDNTITSLARYRYQIEVSNADGVGGISNTAYIVNGPAQQLPLNADFSEEEQS